MAEVGVSLLPQVERVDDTRAKIGGMIKLQVFVTVGRHHREPVARLDAELGTHGVRQAQHTLAMAFKTGLIVSINNGGLAAVGIDGWKKLTVVNEFPHDFASLL